MIKLTNMSLDYDGEEFFVLECHYMDRQVAKAAGFKWNPVFKGWETNDCEIARRFIECATERATRALQSRVCVHGIDDRNGHVFCFACARAVREHDRELRQGIRY
jgi:hypothetical protein